MRRAAPSWVLPLMIGPLMVGAVAACSGSGGPGTGGSPAAGTSTGASGGAVSPGAASPGAASSGTAGGGPSGQAAPGAVAAFRGIVLPDLMIVMPGGLAAGQAAAIKAISGVRDAIVFDGGQINADGHLVSVAGVDPGQFRSWVPLPTATNQLLWQNLANGGFLASTSAATSLGLQPGYGYQLYGAVTSSAQFGGSAEFGIGGIDLLVNPAISQRLGLVRQVAALVSAPGLTIASLTARIRAVIGSGGQLIALRSAQLPVATVQAGQITSYLQLFQASAVRYCPAMSWTVLAAIGQIESADGQNNGPSSAGALGPMQFMPATWAAWGINGFGPAGTPDIMNPLDAVPSAARMLCADGASAGTPAGLRQAIFAYNHANWYVDEVLALAAQYAATYH